MAEKSTAIRRADYEPPKYYTPALHMTFYLDDEGKDGQTRIVTKTTVERNGQHNEPLVLDGEYFDLKSVKVNGQKLSSSNDPEKGYVVDGDTLVLNPGFDTFELEIETNVDASANGAASGLYKQGGSYTTQCEAQGFRRMTYALDRPDNLAKFTTDIIFDPKNLKNALSNGNMTEEEDLGNGLMRRRWEDPHLKPTYLFALCGNNFDLIEDNFTTASGRKVKLEVYAEPKYKAGLYHSMDSLKNAMKWDEDVWGLEYDLDKYMVVADDYFNMGAMENKGLNVFNPQCLLAHPDYTDDEGYYSVERVVGHEYFHNWTGNRVTVQQWLELCLKEGLTVFRDQWFSSDMSNALATRIKNVQGIKGHQIPEDKSPMVHAPRMEEAKEMNNIYTATVYNKGAEVNRVLQTILGKDGFMKGAELYFKRHDGEAVTVEDWVAAHADANNVNLDQFMKWYTEGGVPTLKADWVYNESKGEFIINLEQSVPKIDGVSDGKPRVIPVDFGLIGPDGKEVYKDVLMLDSESAVFSIKAPKDCTPSLLRNFSAPVVLEAGYTEDELFFLAENDTDMFNRWSAMQMLMERELVAGIKAEQAAGQYIPNSKIVDLFKATLNNPDLDDEVKALMLSIPAMSIVEQQINERDPALMSRVRKALESKIAVDLYDDWLDTYNSKADYNKPYVYNMAEKGRRALMNKALHFVAASENVAAYPLLQTHYSLSNNFNDKQAAFVALMNRDYAKADYNAHKNAFYADHKDYVTAVDSWALLVSAGSNTDLKAFEELTQHEANKDNITANRIRALFNGFAANSQLFHAPDGSGYKALADKVIQLEAGPEEQRNPQMASALVGKLAEYKNYTASLQKLMKAELERIAATASLSKNTAEKVEKMLGEDAFKIIQATVHSGSSSSQAPKP